jgi:hypothetical protein
MLACALLVGLGRCLQLFGSGVLSCVTAVLLLCYCCVAKAQGPGAVSYCALTWHFTSSFVITAVNVCMAEQLSE